jgi:hypothetical protein
MLIGGCKIWYVHYNEHEGCKGSIQQAIKEKCIFQPLTEMSTRNIKIIMFLGSKVRRVRKADNLTAIYEPTV